MIEWLMKYSNGCENVIVIGGGFGVMEVGNCGVVDVGGKLIGLNIVLLFEQVFNEYVLFELCFNFYYFVICKMYFLMCVNVICVFFGGFGILDELFEVLILIQIG